MKTAVVLAIAGVATAAAPRDLDAAALTALPSQFINGVKSCWADPSDTQLEFNQCMTTKSIATLEAINKGAGKDLPIAADLTAVLKAAKPASAACVKSSATAEALDACLQKALGEAESKAPNATQKKLIALLGDYADAIYACSKGPADKRATCSGNAIKKVFNSLVPLLAGR